MKSFLFAGLVLFVASARAEEPAAPAPAAPASAAPAPRKMPELVVDTTPIARIGVVTSYADVIEPLQKAVVSVYSSRLLASSPGSKLFQQLFPDAPQNPNANREEGLGSGVIISSDGYIITNSHVVAGSDDLEVLLSDDRKLPATLIGEDAKTDIAVIKIDATNLPVATIADSDKLRVGDLVFAVGNPLAVGQTVTMGIVSAKGRNVKLLDNENINGYEDFIQTDAAINLGNSGGALVDAKGRLVGINSAIVSTSRGDMGGNIGIGFAVPVNIAAQIMQDLILTGSVSRGYLGLEVDPIDSTLALASGLAGDSRGVIVKTVVEGTPAAKAGLKLGDVLVSFDGKAVANREQLRLLISQKAPNSVARVKYYRGGTENTIDVTLGKLAEDNASPKQILEGINVSVLTGDLRQKNRIAGNVEGLIVDSVDPASPYASKLQAGSVILMIEQTPASDLTTARNALHSGANKLYVRDPKGSSSWIGITIANK